MWGSSNPYFEEDEDPTEQDVGKFIPQTELELWWKQMQVKYPQVFPVDDPCASSQHQQGTKLKAFFDDDPNKPIRVEVLGSKFMHDSSGAENKYP
eukprot:CAMPEP_0198146918 /NCGR_PEP_ID=MMETSP1443-20131203/32286_1 /TAXON_ID=186043 /ORGANISM="Entomoneis sp., Strain CCMP2396" /LENGTH=94 /DNA_ID=CAMNT_0043811031 /DNA_START=66 /DNA_END=346 /DNA_ORIENTATION=-